jgi:hypothetical protein
MIIDDHSRLVVGGRLFYNDNAYNFQTVLKSAVGTYCIPDKLYCDLGSPYTNAQLSLICGSIGTVVLHTKHSHILHTFRFGHQMVFKLPHTAHEYPIIFLPAQFREFLSAKSHDRQKRR